MADKLYVKLYGANSEGIPTDWPASTEEVAVDAPDPKDGRLVMTPDELAVYANARREAYEQWFSENVGVTKTKATIDEATKASIARGFVFHGMTFSLSQSAQLNALALYVARDERELTYPIRVITIDDSEVVELADAAAVREFFMAGLVAVRTQLDNGIDLKLAATVAADVG